jgi:hypothetical protein
MVEGVNSPKGQYLGAVIGLKPGLTEFSHPLDRSGQARRHRWLTMFVFDERWVHKLVHPLRLNMHIYQEPFF